MAYQYQRPYYDPDKGGPRRPKKDDSHNDVGYWIVAAFLLMCGAWPVSLIMLLLKLGSDKKIDRTYERMTGHNQTTTTKTVTVDGVTVAQTQKTTTTTRKKRPKAKDTVLRQPKKGAKALMIIGGIAAIVGALTMFEPLREMISYGYYSYMLDDLLRSLGFVLCGACMYGAGRGMKKKEARYRRYLGAIQGQRIVMVKTLASIAGVSVRRVYRDLDDMLEDGQLPADAFVDRARQCLVLDAAAMPYQMEAEATLQLNRQPTAAEEAPAEETPSVSTETEMPAGDAQLEQEYAQILRQIRQVNEDIADVEMSAKIDHIETVTRSIFGILHEKPERRQETRNFFNYYLPTTQKLLNFYAQLEEQPVQSQTIQESRRNIEGIMDNLVKGFEAQLDSLFKADALDISADISVLENMLAKDGLNANDAEDAIARAARRQSAPAQTAAAGRTTLSEGVPGSSAGFGTAPAGAAKMPAGGAAAPSGGTAAAVMPMPETE